MGILRNSANSDHSSSGNRDEGRLEDFLNMLQCQLDVEAKREEFRKYLERAGVIDALIRVLVSLYEETEKPDDALDYVCKFLGGITGESAEVQALKKDLESAKAQIASLQAELVKFAIEDESP